jgi:MFS family permease
MHSHATRTALPRPIYVLFFVRLVNAAGNFVFPFLTMILTIKMGWRADRAGGFMSLMQLLGGLGILAGGKLGDALGRKRSLVICQGGAALLFAVCLGMGLAPPLPYLIAAANFLLQAGWPIFNAIVADIAPAKDRKRAYALLYWGNNIGFSVGPLMAGYLFTKDAGLMFAGNAVALAITSCLLVILVPETVGHFQSSQSDANATAPIEAEPEAEAPMKGGIFKALARAPIIIAFALVVALMNIVYAQGQFGLPIFLEKTFGAEGPRLFGEAMTINGLTVVASTVFVTALSSKLHPLMNMALASTLYAFGFGLLSLVVPSSRNGTLLVAASTIIWTLGEILAATNSNVFIASKAPRTHRSRFNSAVSWMTSVGSMLAPLIAGAYMASRGLTSIWRLATALGLCGAILMLLLFAADTKKRRPEA